MGYDSCKHLLWLDYNPERKDLIFCAQINLITHAILISRSKMQAIHFLLGNHPWCYN